MAGFDADTSSYGRYSETNKLLGAASNSPDNTNAWLGAGLRQQALQQGQLVIGKERLEAINQIASSVLADPSPDNAMARISDGIRTGLISSDDGAHELQTIASFGGDPQKIRQYAFQHVQGIANYQQRMSAAYGTPGTVDNGQTISPVVTREGPQAGIYAAGGNPMQKYMAPGQASAPHTYTDEKGVTQNTTIRGYGQRVGDTAGLPIAQGAAGPSPAPPPGYSGVGNPNSYVDPRRAASEGVSVFNGQTVYGHEAPPTPPGTMPGDVVRNGPVGSRGKSHAVTAGPGIVAEHGQAPGQPMVPGIAGPSPMLGAGLKAYQEDQATASAKMDGVRSLTQALPLIQQLGSTGSGPGTAAFQKTKSALVSAGILSPDTPDVTAYDEAKKYLAAYVAKSALAGRSDMGQLQAQASSPNLETSNAATLALAQNAIAADRMDAARPSGWSGGDNLAGYGQYKAGYTQGQDLRAYKIDLMPADQRMALLKDMKARKDTPEGRKFWQSLQNAHGAGVLNAMGASGGR